MLRTSWLFGCTLLLFIASIYGAPRREAGTALRVAVVSDASASAGELRGLSTALATIFGFEPTPLLMATESNSGASLAPLRDADAAIFFGGPGAALSPGDLAVLRAFLDSGPALVLLAARQEAWPEQVRLTDLIGATPGGPFAAGAPLTAINLFPHPIITGLARLETSHAVSRYEKLAEDAQMIIEGTVGEATTPLAWVRRRATGRLCHIALADAGLLADAVFQRLVANAILWTSVLPIPNARPAVQRTFMPEAHPGAFAITLPDGPGICLDPVRGGINYIWDGDFVDLRPRWITKQGEPARIFGDVFYREKNWQPWRGGSPDRAPDFHFHGYTLNDGYPEFHYMIGDREVHERLTSLPGGGLRRRFRVGAGSLPLWLQLEPQPAAEIALHGLESDGSLACYSANSAGEFTIEIRRKVLVAP